jgi:alanine dehydrogenase
VQLGYVLLPKMPGRDPVTGVTHEQTVAELQAELAIANEHLKALLNQNQLLKDALNEKMRGASSQNSAAQSNPAPAPPAAQASPPVNPAPPPQRSSTSPAADD